MIFLTTALWVIFFATLPNMMNSQEIERYSLSLSHSQLFHGIDVKSIEALVQSASKIETASDQVIIEQETRVSGLHLIVEGSAQVIKAGTALTLIGRGAFFGEISLFGASFSATATVKAKDKTTCLMITKQILDAWAKQHATAERLFLLHMCTELSRRLYLTSEKL